ncbi:MAG: hypothetical protein MUC88_02525 [Planctomycetes bacterium]|jgi:hypothetical protein|nr:hypothetical protein [Planctomycetota bacterium]
MSEKPYRVHIVVDPHYEDRIRNLPGGEPVWIVDSTDNRPVIQAIWQERKNLDQYTGITSFNYGPGGQPESSLISILPVIDLHYYYHDPPYTVLSIIGVSWSQTIQAQLDRFGFFEREATTEGFTAERDLADARPPTA